MKQIKFFQRVIIGAVITLGIFGSLPAICWAQSEQLSLMINADPVLGFPELVAKAEVLAAQSIPQAFADNPNITSLQIRILAERNGAVVPLMTTEIARESWQANQYVDNWIRYFNSAQVLLSYVTVEGRSPESNTVETRQPQEQARRSPQPNQRSSEAADRSAPAFGQSQEQIDLDDALD